MEYVLLGIHHIQLAAPPDSETTIRHFFGKVLGLKEIKKPDNLSKRGGVWFQCGKNQLHIGIQNDFSPSKKAHPALIVRNIYKLRERLVSNEIIIHEDEPVEDYNRFYVDDPFGNRIEFLELQE